MKRQDAKTSLRNGEAETLPHGWQCVRLADLAETCSGTTPSRGRIDFYSGGIPWVKTGELVDGEILDTEEHVTESAVIETSLRLLPKGTVLVAMYGQGQTRGRTGLLRCEATTNQACFAILPNERFAPEFLQFWFRSSYQRLRVMTEGRGGNQPNLNGQVLREELIPLPPLLEQRRIAARLREQFAEVAQARAAIEAQLDGFAKLIHALLHESLKSQEATEFRLADCLSEITEGIGEKWAGFPVLGATRAGLAPAKEPVGKNPGRYKPVRPGTIFYNPMRILLSSIAMVDDDDQTGITSPDYVVMRCIEGRLHPRWFYHWFRSSYGAEFIKSMTRGAVRERLMFRRLSPASIRLPDWTTQVVAARKLFEIRQAKLALADKLDTLDKLPAALLREAFSGRL